MELSQSPLLRHLFKSTGEKHLDLQQIRAVEDVKKDMGEMSEAAIILDLGLMDDEVLAEVLAEVSGETYLREREVERRYDAGMFSFSDQRFKELVPVNYARSSLIIPLALTGNPEVLTLGIFDPFDHAVQRSIQERTGISLTRVILSRSHIKRLIDREYYDSKELSARIGHLVRGAASYSHDDDKTVEMVDTLLQDAKRAGATDIHFSPDDLGMWVRYRINGTLYEKAFLNRSWIEPVCSRIKIMSDLDIATTHAAQDGHLKINLPEGGVDVRVSFFRTVHGENVVLRILGSGVGGIPITKLGMLKDDREVFRNLIRRPQGMVLLTGPTGCGKTTTLYSAIRVLNKLEKNIMTLEDPPEIRMPIVRQSQINERANLTFSKGLRSILRQDPDIILVGEIRDEETAEQGVRAALTGHLVFSTVHTNDAANTIFRLYDLGITPNLMTSVVAGIIAQRLVKRLCRYCKIPVNPDSAEFDQFKRIYQDMGRSAETADEQTIYTVNSYADLCQDKACLGGYKGRIGVFEILQMTPVLRKTIQLELKNTTPEMLSRLAQQAGMKTLWQDGIEKAAMGITSMVDLFNGLGVYQRKDGTEVAVDPYAPNEEECRQAIQERLPQNFADFHENKDAFAQASD